MSTTQILFYSPEAASESMYWIYKTPNGIEKITFWADFNQLKGLNACNYGYLFTDATFIGCFDKNDMKLIETYHQSQILQKEPERFDKYY